MPAQAEALVLATRSAVMRTRRAEGGASACAIDRIEHGDPGVLVVVAAHPDDETVGAGATLGALASSGWRIEVLHVTDGAPRDAALRPTLRDLSLAEAAAVRRREVAAALRAGGLVPERTLARSLAVPDQEAAAMLAPVAHILAHHLAVARADVVVTHPYEGGHPDHDAVAFAVHAAVALHRGARPAIVEMASYHRAGGALAAATFLSDGSATSVARSACGRRREGVLDDAARARRRAMLEAFASQRDVLASFESPVEPLRCAPGYDFTCPPHAGALHYELLPFGWTGQRWRDLAAEALRELGMTAEELSARSACARGACRS